MTPKFRPFAFHRFLVAAASLIAASTSSHASTLTWTGIDNAYWNDVLSFNWKNSLGARQTYVDGDDVIFDGTNSTDSATDVKVNIEVSYINGNFVGVKPKSVTVTGATIFLSGSIEGAATLTLLGGRDAGEISSDGTYKYITSFQSDNTFTGLVSFVKSAAVLEAAGGLGANSNKVNIDDGSTLYLSNNLNKLGTTAAVFKPLTLAGYGDALDVVNSTLKVYSGALCNLSGDNVYSGKVTLSAEALITSLLAPTRGSLTFTGGIDTSGTSAKGYAVVFDGRQDITINSQGITGKGALVKQGAGDLYLEAVNTYSGKTLLNGGNIYAETGAFSGTSKITVNEGTLIAADLGTNTSLSIGPNGSAVILGADLTLGDVYNSSTVAGSLQFTATTGTISLHSLHVDQTTTNVTTVFGSNLYLETGEINNPNAVYFEGTFSGPDVPIVPLIIDSITSGEITVDGIVYSTDNDITIAKIVDIGTISYGLGPYVGSVTCIENATVGAINSGTVYFNSSAYVTSLNEGDITFNGNATVSNLNGGNITIGYKKVLTVESGDSSGVISGFGSLAKTSTGTLTLSGANDYTGGTTISAGKIIGDTTSVQGDIVNNAELEFAQSGDGKFVSKITGSGVVTKSGAGEFEVTETGSIKAKTFNLTEGILLNNGTISGAINLYSGTTIAGSGILIGNITASGATISPGNSPGILYVGGSFTQNGGTFVAELGGTTPGNSNTSYDQLNAASGSVTITGNAVLDIQQWLTFVPTRGNEFQIIKAKGLIKGEFSDFINSDYNTLLIFAQHAGAVYGTGLLSTGSFVDWAGTDPKLQTIYQTVWDNTVTASASSTSTNPAAFIDGSTSDGKLAVAIITGATIDTNLFATDAAESYLGLVDYTNITTRSVMDQAMLRNSFYRQGRWSIGGDINFVNNTYKGGSSVDFNRKLSSTTAFVAVNYEFHDTMGAGFFLGFNDGRLTTANLDAKTMGMVFGLNAFRNFLTKYPITLKAAATTSTLSFDSTRLLYGDATASLDKEKVRGVGAELTAAVQVYKQDGLTISPMLGLVYSSSKADNFSESGSSFALKANDVKSNSTNGILGVSVDCVASARLAFNFMAAYEKILSGGTDELSASSVGGLSPDLAIMDYRSKTIYTLGAGFGYRNSFRSMINFGAQLRNSSDYSKDLRLNLSYTKKY